MKRLAVFAAVLIALSAAMAFGAVQDFGKFTAEVPDGWTASIDGTTSIIARDDNAAAISVTYDSLDGATLKEVADAFVEALGGKDLKAEGDSFTFSMTNANGVDSMCFLSEDGGNYGLIVITGIDNAPEEVAAIMGSITEK